jgi:hypothetical protein
MILCVLVFLGVLCVERLFGKKLNTEDTEKNENTENFEKDGKSIREIFSRLTKTGSAPLRP